MNKHLLSLMILMCSSTMAIAQEEKVIHLDHADSLVGLVVNGEQVQQLIGHVKFTQGSVVVTCQRAMRYLASNKMAFEGEAELWDGKTRMVGSRGTYDGTTKIAEAFDRVMLEDGATTVNAKYGKYFSEEKKAFFTTDVSVQDTASILTSDQLTYFRDEEHAIAEGNVKIVGTKQRMTIYGDHFENFKKKQYNIMTGHPRVVEIDTNGAKTDTLTVTGKTMETYQDSLERLVVKDSVQILRGGLAAEAGLSMFYTGLDSIILRKAPFVWYSTNAADDNQVSGDSIFIKLDKRKLRTVYVRGSAFAISRTDSHYVNRFNQMSGQEIVMQFDSTTVRRIDVDRTATSLYYLFDDGKGNGMNKTTGDHVTLTFDAGKIDKIKAASGVEGQYFPEKMIANKETDYNLQGFNWRAKRPGKSAIEASIKK